MNVVLVSLSLCSYWYIVVLHVGNEHQSLHLTKRAKIVVQWYCACGCCARDLIGSQIPVTTGGIELQISCIKSNYLSHYGLIVCKRFAVQTLLSHVVTEICDPNKSWARHHRMMSQYCCAWFKNRLTRHIWNYNSFSCKKYLCILGQHCTSIFFVHQGLRCIWTTFPLHKSNQY